jgi:hypothetical protein
MSNDKVTSACVYVACRTARCSSCVNKITVLWDKALCSFVARCEGVSMEPTACRKMEETLCAYLPNFRASHSRRMMLIVTTVRNTSLSVWEFQSYASEFVKRSHCGLHRCCVITVSNKAQMARRQVFPNLINYIK